MIEIIEKAGQIFLSIYERGKYFDLFGQFYPFLSIFESLFFHLIPFLINFKSIFHPCQVHLQQFFINFDDCAVVFYQALVPSKKVIVSWSHTDHFPDKAEKYRRKLHLVKKESFLLRI